MSFKRFDQEDIVISADSITAPAWSGNNVTLGSVYTRTQQTNGDSGKYYYNVYNANPASDSTAAIQFSLAYGHLAGSGSIPLDSAVEGYSPSSIIYKQYRTLINGTEEVNLQFGGYTSNNIYVLAIERARFKEKLLPGSLSLKLTSGSNSLVLTDNSNYAATTTFSDAGRVFQLISGSAGVKNSSVNSDGYTAGSGSYGMFLPDAGLIILSGLALEEPTANGGIAFATTDTTATDSVNIIRMLGSINSGANFQLRSEETISSNYVFVRARNSEFNYSTNPSNITGSGELRHSVMIDSPQAYITAVGLYNDNNDLLAVAKLSRPLLKDFTKESLIRIKLDY